MDTSSPIKPNKLKKVSGLLLWVGVLAGLLLAGLIAYRLVSGRSLGLRSLVENQVYAVRNLGLALMDSSNVSDDDSRLDNIIFLHHSTGSNLLDQGQVRELLQAQGYELWDHDYNPEGLNGPDGKRRGYNYNIPNDNTNPGGLYNILQQPEFPLPLNAYSGLLQHDVIVLKSCFRPGNNIRSDEQLAQYKAWYLEMRAEVDAQPEKLFVLFTIPPLNPAETNPGEARRARDFAAWLTAKDYQAGRPNLVIFDFYSALAENDPSSPDYNMLRAEYRDGADSHPNQHANQTLGPVFAEFLAEAIQAYRP
jgi:hypothetical protein